MKTNQVKFTPGPWYKESQSDSRNGFKGLSIFSKETEMRICNMVMQLDDAEQANAKLIAAAPRMYEVILDAIKTIDNHIAKYPMAKTELPELRYRLKSILAEVES